MGSSTDRSPPSDHEGKKKSSSKKRPSGNSAPADPTDKLIGFEATPFQPRPQPAGETLTDRVRTWLIGKPRDLHDQSIFHHISLVAFLAWVGLGADGLSSSCYGPPEAFDNLGDHAYLAVFLAGMTIGTVLIISACYSHIIEEFPSGGGGYRCSSAARCSVWSSSSSRLSRSSTKVPG